ncbi:MAG: DUF192 domain-containing protein [Patescibacteria group bacterium]
MRKQLKEGLSVVVGVMVLLIFIAMIQLVRDTPKPVQNTIRVADQAYSVEIADTPEERSRGLMGRLTLARNEGMLFIFEDSAPRSFWNQDTLIPLDVIFIDQGRVVAVEQLPKFDPAFGPITVSSETPSQYVLELNQGSGVTIGDEATFQPLPGI